MKTLLEENLETQQLPCLGLDYPKETSNLTLYSHARTMNLKKHLSLLKERPGGGHSNTLTMFRQQKRESSIYTNYHSNRQS